MNIDRATRYLFDDLNVSASLLDALLGNLQNCHRAIATAAERRGLDGIEASWTREFDTGAITMLSVTIEQWTYKPVGSAPIKAQHDDDPTAEGWEFQATNERTVWLNVALAPRTGAHRSPAYARAKAALEARGPLPTSRTHIEDSKALLATESQGNTLVLAYESGVRSAIWLYVEATSARVPKGASDEYALQQAAPVLRKGIDELLRMALCARGAIDGDAPKLSKDSVTGFCGEYVASHHPSTASLQWFGGYARFDFGEPGHDQVEVKSTRAPAQPNISGRGVAHISPGQVSAAFDKASHGQRLTWLQVQVPGAVIDELYALLGELRSSDAADRQRPVAPDHPLHRLAEATAVPLAAIAAKSSEILSILHGLASTSATVLWGMQKLQDKAEVLRLLREVGAGLEVPFSAEAELGGAATGAEQGS